MAAYRRHKRKGEEVDPSCAQANRDHVKAYEDRNREESAAVVQLAVASEPDADSSELDDLRENLRIVKAAMREATPKEIASLSKRRQELVREIHRLSESNKGGGLLDEIAARRAARLSGTAN